MKRYPSMEEILAPREAEIEDTLAGAKARISDEGNWTIRAHARDSAGERVEPNSPEAVKWDAVGSVLAEQGRDRTGALDAGNTPLNALCAASLPTPLSKVNDVEGHAAILLVFDRAIAHEIPEILKA